MAKNLNHISEVTRGCHVVMLYTLGQSIKVLSTLAKVTSVSRKIALSKLRWGTLVLKMVLSLKNMINQLTTWLTLTSYLLALSQIQ